MHRVFVQLTLLACGLGISFFSESRIEAQIQPEFRDAVPIAPLPKETQPRMPMSALYPDSSELVETIPADFSAPASRITIYDPKFIKPGQIPNLSVHDRLEIYVERVNGQQDSLGIFVTVEFAETTESGTYRRLDVRTDAPGDVLLLEWLPGDSIRLAPSGRPDGHSTAADLLRIAIHKHESSNQGIGNLSATRSHAKMKIPEPLLESNVIEIHPNYALSSNPLKSEAWDKLQTEPMHPATKVFRVLLEHAERNEKITVWGCSGTHMYAPTPDGAIRLYSGDGNQHHAARHGEFSGIRMDNSTESCTLKLASPYHLPARIEIKNDGETNSVVGDIMLRRPAPEQTATVRVILRDKDNQPVVQRIAELAPIHFSEISMQRELDEKGMAVIEGLAPQPFMVGFFSPVPHPANRHKIEPKAGEITTIRFWIDEHDVLSAPEIFQEPRAK